MATEQEKKDHIVIGLLREEIDRLEKENETLAWVAHLRQEYITKLLKGEKKMMTLEEMIQGLEGLKELTNEAGKRQVSALQAALGEWSNLATSQVAGVATIPVKAEGPEIPDEPETPEPEVEPEEDKPKAKATFKPLNTKKKYKSKYA